MVTTKTKKAGVNEGDRKIFLKNTRKDRTGADGLKVTFGTQKGFT